MIIILPENNNNKNNKTMFSNPFSFEGRIRRTEYGLSVLIYAVAYSILIAISGGVSSSSNSGAGFVFLIFLIPLLWFSIAQSAKRCHDVDHSGWWQLIPFYSLWLLFQEGTIGANQYGEDPKVRNLAPSGPATPQPPAGGGYTGGYDGGHNNPNGAGNFPNPTGYNQSNTGEYQSGHLYN